MSNEALNAAVRLLGPSRAHAMLGCDWGSAVSTDDDPEVCTDQAHQIVILHSPDCARQVKVCASHLSRVKALTDPHRENSAPGPADISPRED